MIKLSRAEIIKLPLILKELGYDVIVPIRSDRNVKLNHFSSDVMPELDYVRIINSPKDFLLPTRELLYRYKSTATITSYGLKIRFPTTEGPCPVSIMPEYTTPKGKLAFFGIHPCMVNSIRYLDKVMLSEPADPYYKARRQDMFVAALECDEGDDYCLCKTVGTYKVLSNLADILMRRSNGSFLVQAKSPKGEEVLARFGKKEELDKYESALPKLGNEYKIESADEDSINSGDASKIVEACTLCGSCTITCPTCYCSDILDKFSLMDPANVERNRVRMSCQRKCYSMIAGGATFLHTKQERFKWRICHKFPFSQNAYNLTGCIGCGNCIAFCPARIDFREFIARRVA
ncbi:MAG: 4Fe-4S dicluster domain-containing protein [Candidatus Methanomethylicus sp.]|nr:4Fe-4S dicluster domain-containing protein [Candidatus Methanomethylicus sp.]